MNTLQEPPLEEGETAAAPRFLNSIRRMGRLALQSVHIRVELFSLELREESLRAVKAVILASASILLGAVTLLLATFTLIFAVWDDPAARLRMLWALSGFYLGVTALVGFLTWRFVHYAKPPFADTLREFEKDRNWIEGKNGNPQNPS